MIKEKTYIRVLWFCALMLPILLAAVFLHAEDVQAMGEAEHILIIDAGHGGEDGITAKLHRIPPNIRNRLRVTVQRLVNDGGYGAFKHA